MRVLTHSASSRGSISIEASIAAPIFLFLVLFLIQICELATVDSVVYEAAVETAEYMAEYAYLMDCIGEASAAVLPAAEVRFVDSVDDKALLEKYITGGVYGIALHESLLPDDEDYILINYSYYVKLKVPLLSNLSKLCKGSIKQKAYLGRGGGGADPGSLDEDEIVYVADYSTVYHRDKGCTYLSPDIYSGTRNAAEIQGLRPCRYCSAASHTGTVYYTRYGEVYHSSDSCSRIDRNIRDIKLSETSLPPCSKCGY